MPAPHSPRTLSLGRALALSALVLSSAHPARAETVKDREGAVRGDKAAMEQNSRWIYNEIDQGFAEAKRAGKPLLIVLRCVPCLACMGIDASVLNSPTLSPWLDQFVRVRLINANAIDLARFQFDFDLSFSALFFNGDGTLYGRFGSWTHQKNSQETDTSSFQKALEGVLALHRAYPANRAELSGKQGGPTPFQTPLEIPALAGRYQRTLDWSGKVLASCIHCHQIGDAFRAHFRDQRQPIPDEWVYPQPAPEILGLHLAPDQAATVAAVLPDSPAAQAGFLPGDRLVSLAGQPMVSIADVSWVLHRTPEAATLPARIQRQNSEQTLTVSLPSGWRHKTDISRRVGTWSMRAMAFGGMVLQDLKPDERSALNLDPDRLALRVQHVGEYGKHAAAKKAGFQKGDILLELDGRSAPASESELIGRLLRNHPPGDQVPALVLRGDQRLRLNIPIQ